VAVFCEEQGDKLRVYALVRAEVSAQEAAYQFSVYRSVVSWKMNIFKTAQTGLKIVSQFLDLGGFSGSVQALKYY
jgi:hypothetical protein